MYLSYLMTIISITVKFAWFLVVKDQPGIAASALAL
jgi:hypothetical protein